MVGEYGPRVCINPLPHNHDLTNLKKRALENTVGKGENACPAVFSTLSKRENVSLATLTLSSANAFNLVATKILSFGNELKNHI